MKISWIILAYNRTLERCRIVEKCYYHNLKNSEVPINEIIWCDNASVWPSSVHMGFISHVKILNSDNLGVAKGYNRAIFMATGDYIVITGCDRVMPEGWLNTWIDHIEKVPNTGVISTYSCPIETKPERYRNPRELEVNGLKIIPAMPMEAKIFSRELHRKIGYLREDFGLYGWEDVEWGLRAERVTKELGLINYIIPGMMAQHLGSEGISEWNGEGEKEYHEFKNKEANDPRKKELMQKCKEENYPYYNPYI